ncbi:MAG: hypothetical protein KC413_04665 [Anaerolineales bacterium]|nr:hypothetical protein [Anaerolineales bacterium]
MAVGCGVLVGVCVGGVVDVGNGVAVCVGVGEVVGDGLGDGRATAVSIPTSLLTAAGVTKLVDWTIVAQAARAKTIKIERKIK